MPLQLSVDAVSQSYRSSMHRFPQRICHPQPIYFCALAQIVHMTLSIVFFEQPLHIIRSIHVFPVLKYCEDLELVGHYRTSFRKRLQPCTHWPSMCSFPKLRVLRVTACCMNFYRSQIFPRLQEIHVHFDWNRIGAINREDFEIFISSIPLQMLSDVQKLVRSLRDVPFSAVPRALELFHGTQKIVVSAFDDITLGLPGLFPSVRYPPVLDLNGMALWRATSLPFFDCGSFPISVQNVRAKTSTSPLSGKPVVKLEKFLILVNSFQGNIDAIATATSDYVSLDFVSRPAQARDEFRLSICSLSSTLSCDDLAQQFREILDTPSFPRRWEITLHLQ